MKALILSILIATASSHSDAGSQEDLMRRMGFSEQQIATTKGHKAAPMLPPEEPIGSKTEQQLEKQLSEIYSADHFDREAAQKVQKELDRRTDAEVNQELKNAADSRAKDYAAAMAQADMALKKQVASGQGLESSPLYPDIVKAEYLRSNAKAQLEQARAFKVDEPFKELTDSLNQYTASYEQSCDWVNYLCGKARDH